MHRVATAAGGPAEGGFDDALLEQAPGELVVLSAADTDLQVLAAAVDNLPADFPVVRAANLRALEHPYAVDGYARQVLAHARAVVVRVLGGRAYWPYGLEVLRALAAERGIALAVLSGDDAPDPDLAALSTVPLAAVERLRLYFRAGGALNLGRALQYLADLALGTAYRPPAPIEAPRWGSYREAEAVPDGRPVVGVLFYRAHINAANTAFVDALCGALAERNLAARPVFVASLREGGAAEAVRTLLGGIDCLVNTTSFSLARLEESRPDLTIWQELDVPVIQAIAAGCEEADWQADPRGLGPRDVAMNVALPEVDGRIVGRAISFKHVEPCHPRLLAPVVTYRPRPERVAWVAELARRWVELRRTPVSERRVAVVLANYPNRDGRLANGVGLDTPASCVAILQALARAGYATGDDLPEDGTALIARLTAGVTNDREGFEVRPLAHWLTRAQYGQWYAGLSAAARAAIERRWGAPPGDTGLRPEGFAVPGVRFGNVFVAIQPARGYDADPELHYHAPDLEPPHPYLAFYAWLREVFGAHAVVHLGKHGNLEWLPGKAVALSEDCFPEVALGPLPHLYPFIVNDPGEGAQAKRRAAAVIVDHLTPPMARAETYGELLDLENAIDEYHEALTLHPARLGALGERLAGLARRTEIWRDLGLAAPPGPADLEGFLPLADGYLCAIKESQIRDGLHIFGRPPTGEQRLGLLVALARSGGPDRPGLTRALASDLGLGDFDPLTADPAAPAPACPALGECRLAGDTIEAIERRAHALVAALPGLPAGLPAAARVLAWMRDLLCPALDRTTEEIDHLLRGLTGGYVPAGPSGAPTRGRPEVLPTGRNFYSVDIRAVPTPSAWDIGRRAAEAVVERYVQEHGEYPRTLGLSVWGTSTMRTGGDDIAEALALLGVQPVWDRASRRVVDLEVLPVAVLGRPRVDVTLRVSGFFRDAFANLIALVDRAVHLVAALDEPAEDNPLATTARTEAELDPEGRLLRIFGSMPGAYGAGLQGLIESQHWRDETDLARAYLAWSGWAYTGEAEAVHAPRTFERRLAGLQVVLHNQDNREHDLLDSDDYYQFQGGMTVAARVLSGRAPTTYFGDHSRPEHPRVHSLRAEVSRVYRSRVVNPKWIAAMRRHGYKGAFELAATVDYLFAYHATARCVEGFMYAGIAERYLFDPEVQDFVRAHNPWVLRDMAERLLEAHQRCLWVDADPALIERLRRLVLDAEAEIEGRNA